MVGATTLIFSVRELALPGSPTGAEEGRMRVEGACFMLEHCVHCALWWLAYPNHCSFLLFNGRTATEHPLPDELASFVLEQVAGSGCSQLGSALLLAFGESATSVCCGNERRKLWAVSAAALVQGGVLWREERTSLAFLLLMRKRKLSDGGSNHPVCCNDR